MLYFIRSGTSVKIGVSERPWERLANLQTAHHERLEMLAIAPGGYNEERELHQRFSEHHQFREWFRNNDELCQLIEEMRQLYPSLQIASRPPSSDYAAPILPLQFDSRAVEETCSFLDKFRQSGGVVEVFEYPDKFIVGLPGTSYKPGYDPTKLYTVDYDNGQITPRIEREMKPRTITDRLNEAMLGISYFIKPPLHYRSGYGVFIAFPNLPISTTEATNEPS